MKSAHRAAGSVARALATLTSLAVVACVGTACGGAGDRLADTSTAAAHPPVAAPPAAPVPDTAPAAAGLHVALDGEGLRLVDAETGRARPLAFGTPAERAIEAVSVAIGAPRERGSNQDCGAGPLDVVRFADGLDLLVQRGRFVGWSIASDSPRAPRTMSGIGLGSRRAALDSAYAATVDSTTLGIEFMAGGLQGVLESRAPTAPIVALWAGASCVAR